MPRLTSRSTASATQIEANRQNAQLSTGPKTDGGRARTRLNALKHGLTARHLVIFDEHSRDFLALYRGNIDCFRPQGTMEHCLVQEITIAMWGLMRHHRIETQQFANVTVHFAHQAYAAAFFARARIRSGETETQSGMDAPIDEGIDKANRKPSRFHQANAAAVFDDLASSGRIESLCRYRSAIERSMYRAIDQVERLQARRHGIPVAPPQVVDVRIDDAAPKQG